jgi:hypothetical protein
VRATVVDHLVRGSDADSDSVEMVRARQVGNHLTVVGRWREARRGRLRRGAVDLSMIGGVWRASGGWSSNAGHDADHPLWRAWGGGQHSLSGWVFDPSATRVRIRAPDGRVETDTVENGVAILSYDSAFGAASVVEVLAGDGTVLQEAPLGPA